MGTETAPATVMQCDNSLEKDVFDVFSKWMFLKSEAVSDKISKDILSLPHFKLLNRECPCHGCREAPKGTVLYNKLHKLHFTLQKMHLSRANCHLSQIALSSPAMPPLTVGKLLASRTQFSHLHGRDSAKSPVMPLQCLETQTLQQTWKHFEGHVIFIMVGRTSRNMKRKKRGGLKYGSSFQ